jgi:hypothetical protein
VLQADKERDDFIAQAENLAIILYAQDVLSSARAALPPDADVASGIKAGQVSTAMEQSEVLLARSDIRDRICPGLLSVSDDVKDIAKIVGAALFPLSLVPAGPIPLTPLVAAAVSLMVLRAGVQAICRPKKSG